MKALWDLGRGTVHEIRARLFPKRPLAYTTVMTVMDRLARKGIVGREKRGRAHLYRPSIGEDPIRERAIARLVENFFQGSRERLGQYLETGAIGPKARSSRTARETRRPVDHPVERAPSNSAAGETLDTTLL